MWMGEIVEDAVENDEGGEAFVNEDMEFKDFFDMDIASGEGD